MYGWPGWRQKSPTAPNGSRQTREIVAARSWAEASRAYGQRIDRNFASTTGNEGEIAQAMSAPGVVFWHPLHPYTPKPEWRRAEPGDPL